ncbi:peptidase [Microbispora corallina]|uniref:Peptidase n=1 Tax=Microbispora corallina TaxID=83302 RepID=A0ABQ4GAX5_9ACTN|nr:hypothetical protein [Microbispora corallina]GIH44166.1 peptidase [Microbispora corallina]
MKRILIPVWGVVATAVLLMSGTPAPAQAYDIFVTRVLATPAEAGPTLAYWLRDDGRALTEAAPYTLTTRIAALPAAAPVPDGKPGLVPAAGQEGRTPATSKNVNLPRTTGRAFFVGPGDRPYWCAATSVQSDHRNLVATAGHCVFDIASGAAFRRWMFVPGFAGGGATPWGVYVGSQAYTHHDFAAYRDLDRDYAFVGVLNGVTPTRVRLPSLSRYAAFAGGLKYRVTGAGVTSYVGVRLTDAGRLGDRVGGQGLAYNLRVGRPLAIFGYRSGPGTAARSAGTPFAAQDLSIKAEELLGIRTATPSVAGSSWLAGYRSVRGLGYLNGLTIGQSGATSLSPYFDGELAAVYGVARGIWTGSVDLRQDL